jgi:glycerol kinase
MIGVIDAGTTNIKLVVYDEDKVVDVVKKPIVKYNPQPGWVEIDADWMAETCVKFADIAIEKHDVEAIAITNQRATAVLWDTKTGKSVFPAVGWQDTRAEKLAEKLNSNRVIKFARTLGKMTVALSKLLPTIKTKKRAKWLITLSRLSLSAGHTSVKLRWMLDELGEKAQKYNLKAGTIDSWLVYKLTGEHATDYSNAAATGIYDSFFLKWSDTILDIIKVDPDMLPEIKPSDEIFGEYRNVPITGVIADQSASLYALGCWKRGDLKVTNGTGTFVDINVGSEPMASAKGLLPLIAWRLKGELNYMMEGLVMYSGSAVELLRDLGFYNDVKETSELAFKSENEELMIVPSFTGLGTPHYVTMPGLIYGISNAMTREDFVRALLESLAFRVAEIVEIMEEEMPWKPERMRCDGEMSSNDFFLQRLADVTGLRVERGAILSGSSFGAHLIAGMAIGKWKKDFCMPFTDVFERKTDLTEKYRRWKKLVELAKKLEV